MAGGPSHGTPGHVRMIVPIELAAPRDITEPDFNELKLLLLAEIFAERKPGDDGL